MVFIQEATYTEVKYLSFRAVESTVLWYGISRILLLWVARSSPRVPGSLCQSLQTSGCMYRAFVTALYLGSRVFQPYLSGPPSGLHRCTHGILHFQALPVVPRPVYLYRCALVHASIPLLARPIFFFFYPLNSSKATLNATSFVTVLSPMVGITASFPEFYAILFTAHSPSPFGFSFSRKQILRRS